MFGELAGHAADRRSDRGCGQQRRCEEAYDKPDASADLEALATQVVTCLAHLDLPFFVLLNEDNALDSDRLVLGELQHCVEVLLREIFEEVGSDHHVLLIVAHVCSFLRVDRMTRERLVKVLVQLLLMLFGQVWVDVEDDLLDLAGERER